MNQKQVDQAIFGALEKADLDPIDPLGWIWERIASEESINGSRYNMRCNQAWEEITCLAEEAMNVT